MSFRVSCLVMLTLRNVRCFVKQVRSKSSKSNNPTSSKNEDEKKTQSKTKDVWKYKEKERWKQTSNFHHNVENFHQFGPVMRSPWMDARSKKEKTKGENKVPVEKSKKVTKKKPNEKSKKDFKHKFF